MRRVVPIVAVVAVCSLAPAFADSPAEQQWSIGVTYPSLESNTSWSDTENRLIRELQSAQSSGNTNSQLKYVLELGYGYWARGTYSKALPMYLRALDITRTSNGIDSPELVICLNNLGLLYREVGNFEASRRMHEDALEVLKSLPNEKRLVADTEFALGLLEVSSGHYTEAKTWLDKAAPVIDKSNYRSIDVARFHDAYTKLYILTAQFQKAETANKKAWGVADKALPPDSLERIQFLDTRASVLFARQRFTEAEKAWGEALRIADDHGIGQTPDVIALLSHLGELHIYFGEPEKAQEYLGRSIRLIETFMGPESADAATMRGELGFMYTRTGDLQRAREAFDTSLSVLDRKGSNRPLDLAMVLLYYGDYFRAQNRWKDAYEQFKRAAEIREKLLGDHPMVAAALQLCAESCKKLKKKDEARGYEARIEEITAKFPALALSANKVDVRTLKAEQTSSFTRR